ncbi:hypothetical protein QBC43DRAFT_325729 [Cladorrhinum sp. PSN259]|nr:hypothetical protein QBC43DRAFT_325729 [Cladorrhinum sp. PSN259]
MRPVTALRHGATFLLAYMTTTTFASRSSYGNRFTLEPTEEAARENAFQIFNAIHSAMRQWGSSINHNGLSVFLATVPHGTILHHGTNSPEPPRGPEWLAFDIEHAEMFARARMGPPPKNQPPGDANILTQQLWYRAHRQPPRSDHDQNGEVHGYLHLYQVTRPLRLLYLDGMSAGNTNMGTLDTQDFLLRGNRSVSIWEEGERAVDLCKILTPLGLDGVLRTEVGFEVINCDFSDSMVLLEAHQRPDDGDAGYESPHSMTQALETIRAVSQRYHGIGGGRVVLNYSSMVSAMFYPVNLTNPNPDKSQPHLRRLASVTDDELRAIKLHIETVILDRVDGSKPSVDWQGVTDLIIARYADRLWNMAENVDSLKVLQGIINGLLNTHMDYALELGDRYTRAKENCEAHYVQSQPVLTRGDKLIAAALKNVTGFICETLFDVRELIVEDLNANEESFIAAKKLIKSLNEKLRWSRWKECTTCSFDEVCFIPMWPNGDKDSYDRPNCRNSTTLMNGWEDNQYWEPVWGGHGPAKPEEPKGGGDGPKDL